MTTAPTFENDQKTMETWIMVSILYGTNVLAKHAKTLGERAWFRMLRQKAERDFQELPN